MTEPIDFRDITRDKALAAIEKYKAQCLRRYHQLLELEASLRTPLDQRNSQHIAREIELFAELVKEAE